MKLKQATLYRLLIGIKFTAIFYLCWGVITVMSLIVGALTNNAHLIQGDIFTLFIFLLISLAFVTMKEEFNLFLQNGVCRKNMFLSNLISLSVISFFVSFMSLVLEKILRHNHVFQIGNLITQLYHLNLSSGKGALLTLLASFVICLAAFSAGLVLASLFQRYSRLVFLVICTCLILIPAMIGAVISTLPKTKIIHAAGFVGNLLGQDIFSNQTHVSHLICTLTVISLLLLMIHYYFQSRQEPNTKGK